MDDHVWAIVIVCIVGFFIGLSTGPYAVIMGG